MERAELRTRLSQLLSEWNDYLRNNPTVSYDDLDPDMVSPNWREFIALAMEAMLAPPYSPDEQKAIELSWAMTNEPEIMKDFAIEHIDKCWGILQYLCLSSYSDTRWQAYTVLGFIGMHIIQMLDVGSGDSNEYCRKIARNQLEGMAALLRQ